MLSPLKCLKVGIHQRFEFAKGVFQILFLFLFVIPQEQVRADCISMFVREQLDTVVF